MWRELYSRFSFLLVGLPVAFAITGALAQAQPQALPNMGQQITPLAPPGAQFTALNPGLPAPAQDWLVSQAVTTVVSPDHKTLLVLTSGYNRFFTTDIQPPPTNPGYGTRLARMSTSSSTTFRRPRRSRSSAVQIPTTYNGIVFDPSGVGFLRGGLRH